MADGSTGAGLEDIARLDLGRNERRGYPEAIFCEGKTAAQVNRIATALADQQQVSLFTRVRDEHVAAITAALPDAAYDADARLVAWPPTAPEPSGGPVLVLAAGTSDLPVAREALLTARYLGRESDLVVDVGVAGLHRILAQVPRLRTASAIVVAAGMDGALPSV